MIRPSTSTIVQCVLNVVTLICSISVAVSVQAAEKYALLVGVSNYPSLPENRQLQGAKNDVLLMQKVLSNIGFSPTRISLLADKVDGASAPTREGILAALNQLRDKSERGDFVYLHFSGHGSQQPITDQIARAKETDGLDEIFLPADIGHWNGKKATVKNAIIDNEFNAAILAIRKKGAFVWAVFDTCHAGTLNRGASDINERSREVLPSELGIPSHLLKKFVTLRRGVSTTTQKQMSVMTSHTIEANIGGFVGFYAAQSDQITTETKFKVDNNFMPHGTFSFALAQILSAKPHLTYRELGQQILNHYAGHNRFFPTPLFESAKLDGQVFDESKTQIQGQWPIHRNADGGLSIPRGILHQINQNSLFALVENTDATASASKLKFAVKSISALNTELKPLDSRTNQTVENPSIPTGSYARLIRPGIQNKINIAFDKETTPPSILKALNKINSSSMAGTEIGWIEKSSTSEGDFELLSKGQSMCLLVHGLPQTCRAKLAWFPISPSMQTNIQALTARAKYLRKVNNLLNFAEQFPAKASLEKFDIQLFATRKNSKQKFPLDQSRWSEVNAGDKVTIEMSNNTARSIDASLLFIDSAQNIQTVFPYQQGEINRIEPQGKHEIDLDITSETLGVEKLVAILAEAQPHSMMQDFSFLAESTSNSRRRGEGDVIVDQELSALFDNEVFGKQTKQRDQTKRSGEVNLGTQKINGGNAIRLYNWIVK
jgi:hypothetical protein